MDETISKWVGISCVGLCLFISAMSWMVMKMGSLVVLLEMDSVTNDSFNLYTYIVTIYLACEVAAIPIAGKLVDRFGEKRVLAVGAMIFVLAAVFASASWTIEDLVIFRGFQGAGAGVVFAVAFSCVGKMCRHHKRNVAHEIMTAAFAVGSLYATMVGYWFIMNWTWRDALLFAAFFMALFAFIAIRTLPDREIEKDTKFDTPGALLVTAIFFTVMLWATTVQKKFEVLSLNTAVFVAVAVALIVLLIIVEKKKEDPAFPVHMTSTHAKFIIAMFMVSLFGIGMIQYMMKMYLVHYRLSIYQGSAMFLFLLAGGACTSLVGCRKVTETGLRFWVVLGSAFLILGFFMMAFFGGDGIPQTAAILFVLGLGFGCMVTEILCQMQGIVGQREMGMYTAILMGLRMVAIALGNVMYSVFVTNTVKQYIPEGIEGGDIIDIINWILYYLPSAVSTLIEKFSESILHCAYIAAVFFAVLAVVGLWIKKKDLKMAEELPDNNLPEKE